MSKYLVQFSVDAQPMTRLNYNDYRGWILPSDEDGADTGYKITRECGHESWMPEDIFKNSVVGEKTLHNSDIEVFGDGDTFELLCKASSQIEGWMKSTKALEVDAGCVIQVTTQQRNPDGSYAVAEALTFVPNVYVSKDVNGNRCLRSIEQTS